MSKTFAVMSGDKVANVIIATSKEDAELVAGLPCIEYTQENPAGIEWTYDSETGLFVMPAVEYAAIEEPSV